MPAASYDFSLHDAFADIAPKQPVSLQPVSLQSNSLPPNRKRRNAEPSHRTTSHAPLAAALMLGALLLSAGCGDDDASGPEADDPIANQPAPDEGDGSYRSIIEIDTSQRVTPQRPANRDRARRRRPSGIPARDLTDRQKSLLERAFAFFRDSSAPSEVPLPTPLYQEARADLEPGPAAVPSPDAVAAAGAYAGLLLGRAPLAERRRALAALARRPDPAAASALRIVLTTPADPLSGEAVGPLAALGTPEAVLALRSAIDDARNAVRIPALLAYVGLGREDAPAQCRRFLGDYRKPNLQAAAVLGLGVAARPGDVPALRDALASPRNAPRVQIAAAWALANGGDAAGRRRLQATAVSEDPSLAPQAVAYLGLLEGTGACDALLGALGSGLSRVWQTAFRALLDRPAEELARVRAARRRLDLPPNPRLDRRGVLLDVARAVRGRGSLPPAPAREPVRRALAAVARDGDRHERLLLAEVLAAWQAADGIDPLLLALEREDDETARAACAEAARRVARANGRAEAPAGDLPSVWRRWWLDRCRARRVHDPQSGRTVAVIASPGGRVYYAEPGVTVAPDVRVERLEETDGRLRAISVLHGGRVHRIPAAEPTAPDRRQ